MGHSMQLEDRVVSAYISLNWNVVPVWPVRPETHEQQTSKLMASIYMW